MNIIEIGRNHFSGIRSKSLGEIEVPEWQDEQGNPTKIYVRPMTMGEASERQARAMKDDFCGFNLSTLIYSACNENMKPMFSNNETVRDILKTEFCPKVLTRIIAEIENFHNQESSDNYGDVEEEKKN